MSWVIYWGVLLGWNVSWVVFAFGKGCLWQSCVSIGCVLINLAFLITSVRQFKEEQR